MSDASKNIPHPTEEHAVQLPPASRVDDALRDSEVTASDSDAKLVNSGDALQGRATRCTGVNASSSSIAGIDRQGGEEFRPLAIQRPIIYARTAPPWSVAFGISVLVHCFALAFAAQWSIQKTRWLLDVERGESATIQLTASLSSPTPPPIKLAEVVDYEPIQVDPEFRELPEHENRPRLMESTREVPMPLPDEPKVDFVVQNHAKPIKRRTIADEMPKVASIPPSVPKRIQQATPPPSLTVPVAPSAVRNSERVGANIDTPPRKLPNNPPPEYPESARRAGYEGRVILRAKINSSGEVVDVAVASSCGYPLLDEAALRSVLKWTFEPALSEGNPTATEIRVPVRFSLRSPG